MNWSSDMVTVITRPAALVGQQVPRQHVGRQVAQDQPDLVDDTRLLHRVDHPVGEGSVDGQRLLAEHGPTGGRCGGDEPRVLGRPRAHEHDVDERHQLVLVDRRRRRSRRRTARPAPRRVVHRVEPMFDAAVRPAASGG